MPNRFLSAILIPLFALFFHARLTAQNMTVTIGGPTVVCPGCYSYRAIVSPSSGNPGSAPLLYQWAVSGPGGFSQISGDSIPTFCFSMAGLYKIAVTVVSGNGTLGSSASLEVTVLNFLPVEIVSGNPAICNSDSLNSDATNQFCEKVCPYSTVTYSLANPPASPVGGGQPVITWNVSGAQNFVVNTPGNLSVTVTWGPSGAGSVSVVVVTNTQPSCVGESSLCVTIVEEPQALFGTDPAPGAGNDTVRICKGQTVWFDNQSQYADTYEWFFSDDFSSTNAVNPQHTFQNPGLYTVRLVALSACFCTDTTEMVVEVLDAEAPTLECVGDVCPGATATYAASPNCTGITWAVSPNGTVLAGGTPGTDSITVQWATGPSGNILLSNFACSGVACPFPTLVRIPIIDDNAEILGAERVCPDAEEVYSIDPFGGTGFVWTLSGGGAILDGQGTNRVSIRWSGFPNPGTTHWLSVRYDNCYLGCGGQDSIPVRIVSPFFVGGPVEACADATGNFLSRLTFNNANINCNWTLRAPDGSTAWTSPAPAASVAAPFAAGPGTYRMFAVPDNPLLTCTDQGEWAIRVPDVPAAPTAIAGPVLVCPGQTSTYSATGTAPDANISWIVRNGPGAPTTVLGNPLNVTWNAVGPYQLRAVVLSANGLGCTSAAVYLEAQHVGAISAAGPAQTCINSTTTYTAPDVPGLDFQWSLQPADAGAIVSGQGTNAVEIFWQLPGTHTLAISACGQTANQAVVVTPDPVPAVVHPTELCAGGMAPVQTAAPFVSYSWENTAGTVLGTAATVDLGPGNFVVSVTDANGCTGSATFSINTAQAPNMTVSTADPTGFCNNSQFVTMQALANSGGPLTYAWFRDGAPLGVTTSTYSTNQYGNYTVQATNAAGCTATAGPVLVFEDCSGGGGGGGLPGGGGPGCPPGSISIQITPSTRCDSFLFQAIGANYLAGSAQWHFGQSGQGVTGTAAGDQVSFVFPNAGQYIVVLFATLTTGGVCRVVDSVNVEVVAQFSVLPACPGSPTGFDEGSAFLPGSGITAWAWDFGDPASGPLNTAAIQTPTHLYAAAGTYPVTLTVTANSGCTSTVVHPADIPQPTAPVITPPAETCAGNALEFGGTGQGLVWDFGDPASGALNTAAGNPVFHTFAAGNYTVTATATDNLGCTATATYTLPVAPNPFSGQITPTSPAPFCEGGSLTLTAPVGGLTYLWSDGSGANTLVVSEEGVYGVTLTDANGCVYVPAPVPVSVTPGPDALIKAAILNNLGQTVGVAYPSYSVCAGEDVRLFAEGIGSQTYTWSTGINGTTIEFSQVRNNLLPVGTHLYTVTITDATSGCTTVSDPFVVTVNPVPSGFSIANNIAPACAGATNTLAYTGPNPGNWQFIWNTGQTDVPLVTTNPGRYFLRVVNEFGCEARSNPLTILPGPNVAAIPAGCHTRCRPDTLCLPNIPNITAWQWYFNGNPVPGATSPTFAPDQSGTYFAQLTDIFGCTNQSGPLTLNLLDGFGNILGQVWSDVNNNGVIDAADTLVSGIAVNLLQGGTPVGAGQSGAGGDFAFTNIASENYAVEVDAGLLPAGWQIVIGQDPASLSGCDAVDQVGLLIRAACLTVLTSNLQLDACPNDVALYNGTPIPAGSSQTFLLTTAAGCDSLVTVSVVALPVTFGTLNAAACSGSSFDFNGTPVAAGTSQDFVLQNALGCDSILTVSVAELPVSFGTLNAAACPGSSFDFNGTPVAAGTSQDFVLQNALGCDSILTVSVAALPVTFGTLNAAACPGSSFDFNGTPVAAGTSQDFVLQNALGCDSILTVSVAQLPVTFGTLNAAACPGSSFDFNGTPVAAGTSQDFVLQNALGCDSILTVSVAALPVTFGTLNAAACPGSSFDFNGTPVAAGTSQDFVLQNALGCDSILTVSVAALPVTFGTLNAAACSGSTFDFNGTPVAAGTSQDFVLQNALGCDSILTVSVAELPVSFGTLNAAACPGSSFDFNGTPVAAGTSQDFVLQNALGCDSILTVSVAQLPTSAGGFTAEICAGETFTYNGTVLQAGAVQDFVLQNHLGCDSVVTVSVIALPTPTGMVQAGACPGQSFTYQGVALPIGAVQQFTFTSTLGCDSIVTVSVSALSTSSETLSVTVCPNETYMFGGVELRAGDVRTFTYTNSAGCDSTVVVRVSAFPAATFGLAVQSSCSNANTGSLTVLNPGGGLPPYRFSIDGSAFQDEPVFGGLAPGAYTVWLEDSNGCLLEQITGIPAIAPLAIELNDAELPCSAENVQLAPVVDGDPTGLTYQWSTGAQTAAIAVDAPGVYAVEVRNVCETVRREVQVQWADVARDFSFLYVPNVFAPLSSDPDNSLFRPYFVPGLQLGNYRFEIFDRWGNLMFRTTDTEAGWRGPFRAEDMQPAVFVWYLLVDIDYCGRVQRVIRQGDVTIVR
ncbi:MAG: PKD domain-containing protein [Lewinellaceae bacterium]|nr:PKD domain-containing protein [Lewinellaceae bacterium]